MRPPSPAPRRHRAWRLVRGAPAETASAAAALLAGLDPAAVLWVGDAHPPFAGVERHAVRRLLGQAFDAVVIDGHAGLDADLLGQSQGFIWGGGLLILRLPVGAPPGDPGLVVAPYTAADVGQRFFRRVEAALADPPPPAPVQAARAVEGTAEQAAVVARLAAALRGETGGPAALLSDRGRGKSSALGLALRGVPGRVAVTADHPASAAEVFHFAGDGPVYVPVDALARGGGPYDAIAVDEAAQIPVPELQRIVRAHPAARFAFATTARGYEGTGRGFVLRFLAWLDGLGSPVERLTLTDPIRWAAGDPLEARIAAALLLDAEPDPIDGPIDPIEIEHALLPPDRLAADEALLRGFFGLLVHAHYRTTPSDLHRLLDAPNLGAHALLHRGRVVAACLVAEEGGLDAATIDALARGAARIRGHALAETLVCHAGHREAGALRMIRSVRIATHPALRRLGLGQRLVDAVHRHHAPDLFGTVFGATPALLRFRRAAGYALVRVGVNPGSRTGEPAAVMLRPVSPRAVGLCEALRAELARDLPTQLALMRADDEIWLAPRLVDAFGDPMAAPAPLTDEAIREGVMAYAFGPRPLEAAGHAIAAFVTAHAAALPALGEPAGALLAGRLIERRGWATLTARLGLGSVRAAMRAARRAMQALVAAVEPGWLDDSRSQMG
ncbi:MAG: tRNA(Met) cytidine acetyltransferase [Myxococcales bacterium]|nr:tRNA(Met) cytidine acetyltransferase [Myxococcales bacterium]